MEKLRPQRVQSPAKTGDSSEMKRAAKELFTVGNAVLQDRIELNAGCGPLRLPVAAARTLPQQALTGKTALLALVARRCAGEFR